MYFSSIPHLFRLPISYRMSNCDIYHQKHNWLWWFSNHLTLKKLALNAVLKLKISSSLFFQYLPRSLFQTHGIILETLHPSNRNLYSVISYREDYLQLCTQSLMRIHAPLATIRLRRNFLR